MLTHDYTYTNILDRSVNNAWTVEDCYRGRDFDFTKSFLPERIAGVRNIACSRSSGLCCSAREWRRISP